MYLFKDDLTNPYLGFAIIYFPLRSKVDVFPPIALDNCTYNMQSLQD